MENIIRIDPITIDEICEACDCDEAEAAALLANWSDPGEEEPVFDL